jgi:hypothetical protein
MNNSKIEKVIETVRTASRFNRDYEQHWEKVLPDLRAELARLLSINPDAVVGVTMTGQDAVKAAVCWRESGWAIGSTMAAGMTMSGRVLIGSVFGMKDWDNQFFCNGEKNAETLAAADDADNAHADDQWLVWVGEKDPNESEFARELVGWAKWIVV